MEMSMTYIDQIKQVLPTQVYHLMRREINSKGRMDFKIDLDPLCKETR